MGVWCVTPFVVSIVGAESVTSQRETRIHPRAIAISFFLHQLPWFGASRGNGQKLDLAERPHPLIVQSVEHSSLTRLPICCPIVKRAGNEDFK
jgi:hypothetical protein